MKESIQYLEKIKENFGDQWKEKLDFYLKNEEDDYNQDERNCISNFLNACKEDTIEGDVQNLKRVEKIVDNDLVYKNITSYVEGMLKPYFAAAPLRAGEIKDKELVKKVIEDTFSKVILRYNPEILNRYSEYGFKNQDAFVDFITTLDILCSFVIERNYCYETIEDVVYSHMRLSNENCKIMATLIDNNFDKLKMNYIIEKLSQNTLA